MEKKEIIDSLYSYLFLNGIEKIIDDLKYGRFNESDVPFLNKKAFEYGNLVLKVFGEKDAILDKKMIDEASKINSLTVSSYIRFFKNVHSFFYEILK